MKKVEGFTNLSYGAKEWGKEVSHKKIVAHQTIIFEGKEFEKLKPHLTGIQSEFGGRILDNSGGIEIIREKNISAKDFSEVEIEEIRSEFKKTVELHTNKIFKKLNSILDKV